MHEWITAANADVVMAWASLAGVVVAFFAALFALSQLRMIRKDSRERTRPYVQLDVVPGLHGPGSWDLIVENRGASAALQVVIDAGLFTPLDADDHIAPIIGDYLLTPKTLVPGARRRVMWGLQQTAGNVKAGVLEPREATVTYIDERKAIRSWGSLRHIARPSFWATPLALLYSLRRARGANPTPEICSLTLTVRCGP